MSDRVPIPKSLRFDVLKRDSFTCQYCGAKAPDVLLHVDHIHPVARGGKNEMLNLVTACSGCNGGKGAGLLSENATIERQRAQLEELQSRREQLEMLIAWRDGLDRMSIDELDIVSDRVQRQSRGAVYPTEEGRDRLRRWIKRYGLSEVLQAIDDAFAIYLKFNGDEVVRETAFYAFQKIGWALWTNRQSAEKPYIKKLLYIQGIIRNRFQDPSGRYLENLEELHVLGRADDGAVIEMVPLDRMERFSLEATSWDDFCIRCNTWARDERMKGPSA